MWKKSTVVIKDHIEASKLLNKSWAKLALQLLEDSGPRKARADLAQQLHTTFVETSDSIMDTMPSPFKALAEDALEGVQWDLISDHLLTKAYRQPLEQVID